MRAELYKIVDDGVTFTITSFDEPYEYNGDVYTPYKVSRNEIEAKSETIKSSIDVSIPLDTELAKRYLTLQFDSVISLTIFTVIDDIVSVAFKGRLSIIKPDVASLKLTFESLYSTLKRTGLNRLYQRSCSYVLYSDGCSINKESMKISGHISSVASDKTYAVVDQASSYPNGYFTGGMFEFNGERRLIIKHIGPTLTFIRPFPNLVSDSTNTNNDCFIYPGCDRTKETCKNKFNNINNFGGFPFIPLVNPHGAKAIL